MGSKNSLKQLIQSMIVESMGTVSGTVTSTKPLTIQIEGDEKLSIGAGITYVPEHLTDHVVPVSFSSYTGAMEIKGALKKGDTVFLLSTNHGKQYYVMDRIEVVNDG